MAASDPPVRAGTSLQDRGNPYGRPAGAAVAAAASPSVEAEIRAPTERHCWVMHPHLGRLPGLLLLHWAREHEQWRALVVYVDDRGAAVTTWVPGEALTPRRSEPPQPPG